VSQTEIRKGQHGQATRGTIEPNPHRRLNWPSCQMSSFDPPHQVTKRQSLHMDGGEERVTACMIMMNGDPQLCPGGQTVCGCGCSNDDIQIMIPNPVQVPPSPPIHTHTNTHTYPHTYPPHHTHAHLSAPRKHTHKHRHLHIPPPLPPYHPPQY
jgi:hypothetical protein